MADPSTYRPAPGSVPDEPGVYRFRDPHGRVIYVGKAKSLRQRLGSYFQDLAGLHPRTQTMVTSAASVDWTVVGTEVEALQLEYSWIKEFDPRFNVRYRDDKSYPYLAVTLDEEYPRVQVMRGGKRKGVRYFGPYSHAWAIRETVDLLLRVFPARTCSNGVFRRAGQVGRPCLLGYIGKCSAPCVGRVSADEHRRIAEDFCAFMSGQTERFTRRLEAQMRAASAEQDYERAARLRDDIGALRRALEKNAVVLGDGTDADVVALAEDPLEAAVQVFHVRGGRIRGQRGFVVERVEELGTGDLVEQLLLQLYGGESGDAVPREVLVPDLPADVPALAEWLTARRGGPVELRVPQRGDKRALMETVARNAEQSLVLHKTRRAGDLTARSRALAELQEGLGLDQAPLRIECFDVSNLQGTEVVASMVVFEDGVARKSEYRRFAVRGARTEPAGEGSSDHGRGARTEPAGEGSSDHGRGARTEPAGEGSSDHGRGARTEPAGEGDGEPAVAVQDGAGATDDVRSIHEVVSRRFRRYLDERSQASDLEMADGDEPGRLPGVDPDTGRPRKFSYPPNLLVVDGGAPQVAAAQAALDELGIDDVAVAGLAKRLEEVWLPRMPDPVILPRTSEGLYLLQRVRDEAHRFAITYHRQRRSRRMVDSLLDGVPGLGDIRRTALLKRFGSLKRLRAATLEELAEVPGIGPATAQAIVDALADSPTPEPAVNVGTGEILP